MRSVKTTLASKWFQEVWNEGNRNSIDELLSEDIIAHGLAPEGELKGIEEFKKYYDDFRKEFENVHVTLEDVISEDDMESSLCTVTATHSSSRTQVKFSGQCLARVKDGKIAEAWNNFDFHNLYKQLA